MRETRLDVGNSRSPGCHLGVVALLLVALAWAAPARGQATGYLPSSPTYYSNVCGTQTAGQAYEYHQALLSFFSSQS